MNISQLETCIDKYGKDIYAFCRHITQDVSEAEDLYQDTFLKAMEILSKIDCENNPKSYLLSIALRLWKNQKRKKAWRMRIAPMETYPEDRIELSESGNMIEDTYLIMEQNELIRRKVEKLEDKYRIPIYLFYTEQLTVEVIGKILKLPTGTVKSRLHKARKILRKELEVVINEK